MTIYDGVMAAVLLVAMARGAWRGITWQLASIASLVLGYLFSYPISGAIAPHLSGAPESARAMSMAGAYVAVSSAVFGAAWMVRNTIRKLKFDAYDRHLGMMLGAVEGVAVGILGTMLVVSVAPDSRTPIFSSVSGKAVNAVVGVIAPILPGEVHAALEPYWPKDAAAIAAGAAAPATDAPGDQPQAAPAGRDSSAFASRIAARLDAKVGPAGGDSKTDADADADPDAATADAAVPEQPSARQVVDGLVGYGKRKAEQTLVDALDVDAGDDPDGKPGTLRELFERDKGRLQQAVAGTVDETRRNITGQLESAAAQTRDNVVEQVQGRVAPVQKQADQVRSRINGVQNEVRNARQRLEQGADGAIDQVQKRLENSISSAIDKGLGKLGLPEAPAPRTKP